MSHLRGWARDLAARSGALALRHRLRNAPTLTIAMFHRVTRPGTPAARTADPLYTLDAPLFIACLGFFRRHYAVIGLDQLRAAVAGGPPLPPRALLLTFDDGWRDNLEVAAPLLRAAGLPGLVFVAADVLDQPTPWWWQEVLLRALRSGRHDFAALWAMAGPEPPPPPGATPPELLLLLRHAALPPARRQALLAPLAEASGALAEGPHMLDPAALGELAGQLAIGAHGARHLPLSMLAEPGADMARARAALAAALPGQAIDTLSFPHGRYDGAVLRAAGEAGYALLFTSDSCLNAAPGGRPGRVLGRINIEAGAITDAAGRLDAGRLATWIFNRPIRALADAG
jgi:peptidoglycan/xylan/chitin deacetylase (PgdA/CDA1 family)